MHCPSCGHENAAGANFCSNCGSSLTITCAVCHARSAADANFCNNCGAALGDGPVAPTESEALGRLIPPEMLAKLRSARSGRAMAGERRTVTMLFADVKGSTSAAEQMDPEEWADLMNSAFERLIEPIYRYEGTLARLLGDAVLAFFGAPIAHEDDPTRAVRAGLDIVAGMAVRKAEILDRYGVDIDVRVGINTGLVVVGEVGSDLRVEYTALGDAINVAARMEQTAEPGTVQVSERTFALTHGAFRAEDLGLVEVKGKAEPIRTFRPVIYVGAPLVRPLAHGFVGRDAELAQLVGLMERLASGSGWVASVIGEAGLGKSALLAEWGRRSEASLGVARHPDEDGDLAFMTGASQSYDAAKPMSGFRTVLRRWFRIDGDDGFTSVAAALGPDADRDLVTLLAHVAGAPLPDASSSFVESLPPPVLLQRSRQAVVDYVRAEAARRPLLIGFEDLHWSDDLTIDLVGDLLATTETDPVGVVFAMRPYRDDPSWRVHERATRDHVHRYHPIELEPLEDTASQALLEELVDDLELGDAELATILDRSDGNPLFLEEIAGSLGAGGTIDGVPDSLAGVLAARLDRLEEQARLVAQVSSVLGTEFRRETVLTLVAGEGVTPALTDLLRQGVLVESATTPGRLRFRHALLRDAAYSSVLLKTRRSLHGEVARYLAEVVPDAAPDIARHFVAAEDFDSAFPYLVEAGAQATRAMALADAIRDLRLAIERAPADADPEIVERAHLALGEAYALIPDLSQSAAAFQRLFDYGEQADRPTAQVAALNHLGFTAATVGGDTAAANEYLRQARILAEQVGDELGLVEYHMNACMVAAFVGDPAAAASHDQKTIELGAAIGDERIRMEGLRRRTMNQTLTLDFEQAEASMELALPAAEQLGSEQSLAELKVFGIGLLAAGRGRYEEAASVFIEAIPTLGRYASFDFPITYGLLGEAQLVLGAPEDALSAFVETRRYAAAAGQPFTEALGTAGIAAAYAVLGRPEEALTAAGEAAIGLGPMGDYFASSSWALLGSMHLTLGDAAAAADTFTHGVAAPAVVQYLDRARLLSGLARALVATGDIDRAATIVSELGEFVERRPMAISTPLVAVAQGCLAGAAGDVPAARLALGEAIAGFDALQARWPALEGATALAELDPSTASEAVARAEAMAASIIDEELRTSFLARWADPARAGA